MKWSISNFQFVLFISYALFAVRTLALIPEAVKAEFIAHRRHQHEARLAARQSVEGSVADTAEDSVEGMHSELVMDLAQDDIYNLMYSSNWAGAVQTSPPSGTFKSVAAEWVLPTVSRPPSASGAGTWYSSEWIGIDGYSCPSAILQAGTLSYVIVDANGGVTTGAEAWYEWYPAGAVVFSNFSVAAGQNIKVTIKATSNSTGTVTIQNFATDQSISTPVSAPNPSATLCGSNAEWILEDFSSNGLVPFSAFTDVYFKHCTATTTMGDRIGLNGSTLINILQSNTVLATTVQVSSSQLEVSYG